VYRHFPDDTALFDACSAHWLAGQIPPAPDTWAAIPDAAERLRTGLADLYRFYRDGQTMLTNIYRDKAAIPEAHRDGIDQRDAAFADVLATPFDGPAARRALVRALIGHAISFWTWRSLCVDQRVPEADAVEAMVGLVLQAAQR
jgi:AcrR family transcriptional regulator